MCLCLPPLFYKVFPTVATASSLLKRITVKSQGLYFNGIFVNDGQFYGPEDGRDVNNNVKL